jgi:hypothetical protein
MTNEQLYLAIGLPVLFNAVLITLLVGYIHAKFDGVNSKFTGIDARFEAIDARFEAIDARFDAINQRFDDMRDLWRAELHRVEEVIDARLKHLEGRV